MTLISNPKTFIAGGPKPMKSKYLVEGTIKKFRGFRGTLFVDQTKEMYKKINLTYFYIHVCL